jgi:hypothetical protein
MSSYLRRPWEPDPGSTSLVCSLEIECSFAAQSIMVCDHRATRGFGTCREQPRQNQVEHSRHPGDHDESGIMAILPLSRRHFVIVNLLLGGGCAGCATEAFGRPRWDQGKVSEFGVGLPSNPSLEPTKAVAELLELHNRERGEAKLPLLHLSNKLRGAAEDHARDMAARHKMTHAGSDGSTSASRITAQGYRYRRCGENIAYGPKTAEGVMKGWMNSPPHRRNILGSFSQIGAACAIASDGTVYWCVTFGFPARPK